MDHSKITNFYLQYSKYTFPGNYETKLKEILPKKINDLGLLVRKQLIHKVTFKNGNTGSNEDLKYGDINKIPWYRQAEDDIFPTAAAMIAELYRRDPKGPNLDRSAEDKLILTCRFTSILMASLLKIMGIPARVRSGFAPYFDIPGIAEGKSMDHWINQYWNADESRWITIDVDGSLEKLDFNPYDIPNNTFDFAADAWLSARNGEIEPEHFWNGGGTEGLIVIAWELFYDFHCLMNDEIIYTHTPEFTFFKNFPNISDELLAKMDHLATLMQDPDANFEKIKHIWTTDKKFRLLGGSLL